MDSNDLIEINTEKRKQLNKQNEAYYDNMLVYIRTHLTISEQQTEELLLEILDHLLEAQDHGKSAAQVFGDDPQVYGRAGRQALTSWSRPRLPSS
jgi:DNA-binding ferritin-like protein (Dps family)